MGLGLALKRDRLRMFLDREFRRRALAGLTIFTFAPLKERSMGQSSTQKAKAKRRRLYNKRKKLRIKDLIRAAKKNKKV
jgi:hypothetical protein